MLSLKLKIYLDTSVISFIYADDAPEKRDITKDYFEKYIKTKIYEHKISIIVTDELGRTKDKTLRSKLLKVPEDYDLEILSMDPVEEVSFLGNKYIEAGIIPQNKIDDALHVAFCTIHKFDFLLSWNYKHLSNINKEKSFLLKNIELGYLHTPRLTTPLEVFND